MECVTFYNHGEETIWIFNRPYLQYWVINKLPFMTFHNIELVI